MKTIIIIIIIIIKLLFTHLALFKKKKMQKMQYPNATLMAIFFEVASNFKGFTNVCP